jgi:hypothetical protein
MKARVVCISRTLAAGGEIVGRRVAADLGFRYVDEEIIVLAGQKADVAPGQIAKAEHRQPLLSRLLDAMSASSLQPATYFTPSPEGAIYYLPGTAVSLPVVQEDYRTLIRSAIEEVALQGNAVIVAHAASFALAGTAGVLRVLITASEATRIERMSFQGAVEAKNAAAAVAKSDRERREYLSDFYGVRDELPTHYDLVINTDVVQADQAAALVVAAART